MLRQIRLSPAKQFQLLSYKVIGLRTARPLTAYSSSTGNCLARPEASSEVNL